MFWIEERKIKVLNQTVDRILEEDYEKIFNNHYQIFIYAEEDLIKNISIYKGLNYKYDLYLNMYYEVTPWWKEQELRLKKLNRIMEE